MEVLSWYVQFIPMDTVRIAVPIIKGKKGYLTAIATEEFFAIDEGLEALHTDVDFVKEILCILFERRCL